MEVTVLPFIDNTCNVGKNIKTVIKKGKYKRDILVYLALINRAGGLYGRILTEAVSTMRPNAVRSVLTTEVQILQYSPTKLR